MTQIMGRPTKYAPRIAEQILTKHANGESLKAICAAKNMPDRRTVQRWVEKERGTFAADLARARVLFAEAKAFRAGEHFEDLTDADLVELKSAASAAVKIRESRSAHDKWLAARMDPKWGDRVDVSVSGSITSHLEVGGMLAHAITGGSAAGAVTPQALGTARVTVDDERVDDDTHDVDVGEDDGASAGREADSLDVVEPD